MQELESKTLKFYDDGKTSRETSGKVIYYCSWSNIYLVEMTVWGYGAEKQKPSRHLFTMKGNRLEGYQTHYLDEEGNYHDLEPVEWACSEEIEL